jgi:hypothetical protein
MEFPTDKFYVTHFTEHKELIKIVKSRSLQPTNLIREIFQKENPGKEWSSRYEDLAEERGEGDLEKYGKSVFYSIIFPDNDGLPIILPNKLNVLFVFSPKIIEDNANMVGRRGVTENPIFCKGWHFGEIKEDKCIRYNKDLSLNKNLNNFRNKIQDFIERYHKNGKVYEEKLFHAESQTLNSELLMEGEMPIDLDLLYIYVPDIIMTPEALIKKHPMFAKANEYKKELQAEVDKVIEENPDLPWIRTNPFSYPKGYYFIHTTPIKNMESILKDGYLKKASEIKDIEYDSLTPDKVFLQLLDVPLQPFSGIEDSHCVLFFKPTVFRDYPGVFNPGWSWGDEYENSYKYDNTKSLQENLETISKINNDYNATPLFGPEHRNELAIPVSLSIDKELIGVYVYDRNLRNKLREKYPSVRFINKEDKDFTEVLKEYDEDDSEFIKRYYEKLNWK